MKLSPILLPLLLFVFCASAFPAEARSVPHEKRSSAIASSGTSSKLGGVFTNDAGDISIAPPMNWLADQSETWSKSADGIVDYSETVNVTGPNSNAYMQITANAAQDDTLATLAESVESSYDTYDIVGKGSTTVGTDPAYFIEAKDSYSHYKEIFVIKNGWEYHVTVTVYPRYWKKYSVAVAASLATLRFNVVPN